MDYNIFFELLVITYGFPAQFRFGGEEFWRRGSQTFFYFSSVIAEFLKFTTLVFQDQRIHIPKSYLATISLLQKNKQIIFFADGASLNKHLKINIEV
jgi:hypothetical protein